MLIGNFYFIYNFAFGLFFEGQRKVYSDRRNRPRIRFQTHIPSSFCSFEHIKPCNFQLYILQLVWDLGKREEVNIGREVAFYIITFFYGMNCGLKVRLASFRP